MKNKTLKDSIRRLRYRIPVETIGVALAMMLLSSCTSAVYDVRQIQQPIVLNDNPFLAPATPASLNLAKVDTYSATVYRGQITASYGNGYATTTTSTLSVANQAQVNAFQAIGGQPNKTICGLSLDIDYLAFNGLFVLADKATIQAAGDVAQFRTPIIAPPAAAVALTNQAPIPIQSPKE